MYCDFEVVRINVEDFEWSKDYDWSTLTRIKNIYNDSVFDYLYLKCNF
jgi:hypothetical protein